MFPLPRIDTTLDQLSGSSYFTALDLMSGYWQVGIKEGDAEKTAFSTVNNLYQFNVMPFGAVNAPSIFQRLMNLVLSNVSNVLVYLDDVIIYSKTWEQHIQQLENVLQRFIDHSLVVKLSKCNFAKRKVTYLGQVVSEAGVQPDQTKIQAVVDYPTPQSSKDVRAFLGLSGIIVVLLTILLILHLHLLHYYVKTLDGNGMLNVKNHFSN